MTRIYHQTIYHLHHFILKLRQHSEWVYTLIIVSALLLLLNNNLGEIKPLNTWDWLDIIGEGATTLFIAIWLFFMLASRSKGTTTKWLGLGILMFYVANFQDLIDEFIQLPIQAFPWDSLIESLPIGLSLLTIGLISWYKEQQLIQQFLAQRCTTFENNKQINRETGLATMQVMLDSLTQKINNSSTSLQLNLVHLTLLNTQTNQTTLEQPAFKRYCADTLVNNLPHNASIYLLTKNNYAIVTELSTEKNNALMIPLIQLIRSFRFYDAYNNTSSPCRLCVSNETHLISGIKTITEVEKLIMDNIEYQAKEQKTFTLKTSIG